MSLGKLTLIVCSCVFFVVFVGLMMGLLHTINTANLKMARYLAIGVLWLVPFAAYASFEQVRTAVVEDDGDELKQIAIAAVWTVIVYVIGFVIFRP